MKKAFMLVAAIALLAAPVFAEVEVTISGDATTSFGYNLDTEAWGMLSEVGADVEIMVGALDGESMGEGNWYGVITLDGAALNWYSANQEDMYVWVAEDDGDGAVDPATAAWVAQPYYLEAPEVTAKITNGNVYVQLQSEAGFDADFVDDEDMEDEADSFSEPTNVGSVSVGGTFAPVTAEVEFGTESSYESIAGSGQGVVLAADVTVDLAPITIDLAYAGGYGYTADQDTGIAAQVTADLAPVTVVAAFDSILNAGTFTWEMGLNVDVALDPITVGVDAYYATDNLDAMLTVGFENDMLTADASLELFDITTTLVWGVDLDVTVNATSGIAFNAGWSYDSADMMAAYANVEFTELVDNVTFTVGWEEGDDLLKTVNDGVDEMGQIVFSAAIEY